MKPSRCSHRCEACDVAVSRLGEAGIWVETYYGAPVIVFCSECVAKAATDGPLVVPR